MSSSARTQGMVIPQTQKTDEDMGAALPNNPFIPPKGDICFINNLPPELLSRIFELGSVDDGLEDEDEIAADFWENIGQHLDKKGAGVKSPLGSDVEMKGELEDEETDTESDSEETGSYSLPTPWPPFPIVASHVCRHWRNVAFSTPSLWTTIPVTPVVRPPYEPVAMLLERSKDLPVSIYVDCEPEEDERDVEPPSEADLNFLFSMLIPHIHRWRVMEITVADYDLMYTFLTAASHPSVPAAPQLTRLELYDHEDIEDSDTFSYPSVSEHFTLFGGSAPMLSRIILWGVHVDWNQSWIASASNLVELELAYHAVDVRPSWGQFCKILIGASSLQKLSLRLSGPSGDPSEWFIDPTPGGSPNLNAPIQLPRVTDFILAFQSQARAIGLIRKLYLPALKNLVLDFDNEDYTEFVRELAKPVGSPSPSQEQPHSLLSKLESLKIAGLPCRNDCIPMFYSELQNLVSLNLSMTYLDSLFLDTLCTPCTLAGRGTICLPRLVTLYVSGTNGIALCHLVQERKDMGVPLSSLFLEESCEVDKHEVDWLQENVTTFAFFEGSDDEDVTDYEDLNEVDVDEWSDHDMD